MHKRRQIFIIHVAAGQCNVIGIFLLKKASAVFKRKMRSRFSYLIECVKETSVAIDIVEDAVLAIRKVTCK